MKRWQVSAVRADGFTLIELVVTIAILGLLATVAVPFTQLVQQRHKEAELRDGLRQIRTAIDAYKQAVSEGRLDKDTLAPQGYPPDLDVLWKGVTDKTQIVAAKDKIYFLRRLPRDPFFPDEQAEPADTWGKRSYASPPDDPQEGDDVYDVYSLSEKTGLNGVPYREW